MGKLFTLEALDAKQGDALLLHYGDSSDPRLIVIDGGPAGVFARSLGKRLDELRQSRHDPLPIRLVMISHVDDDHIRGILDLTDQIERRADQGQPPRYVVDDVWFNAFDDVVGNVEVAAFRSGSPPPADLGEGARDAAATIASVGQGRTLRDRANRLGLRVNGGERLLVDGVQSDMGDGLTLQVLGPSRTRLKEFQAAWDEEVRKKGWAVEPSMAEVAAFLDESPTNLASTIVLAWFDGKTILLTGDARGDDVLEGLRNAGLLGSSSLLVDVLKLPHHGSDRNVSTYFFRKVRARHYVVSGNGEHENPDVSTYQMILSARGNAKYTIHSTYRNGVDGHAARMDEFLAGIAPALRAKFSFREEGALGLRVDLAEPIDA